MESRIGQIKEGANIDCCIAFKMWLNRNLKANHIKSICASFQKILGIIVKDILR